MNTNSFFVNYRRYLLAGLVGCCSIFLPEAQNSVDVQQQKIEQTQVSNKGLDFHFLSANHCIVKVLSNSKYVLLPIEEAAPEAKVNLVVDNNRVQSHNIRLATSKVDYFVPLQIDNVQGDVVLLDIVTNNGRNNVRDLKADACWKQMSVSDTFDSSNREKYRPSYHHAPVYGWMNDPNGMFYKDGEYHLYYQYNPYGSMWGNIHWGHAVSSDLINWKQQGVAIAPDALGTVFSGSCVVDKNNTAGFGKDAVIAIYTSAAESQTQSLAYSTDGGYTFKSYKGNPIITAEIPDFRDPNMFWNEETGKWNMTLACGQEMWIYSSPNLKDWELESKFGEGYGAHGGVWECPDLMELPVRDTNEKKWVLICNLNPGGLFGGSATQYFVGEFDGKKFTCDSEKSVTKWLDYGKDHYAMVSWSNAPRNTVVAWMSNWQYANQVPTKQYRSANTLARDLELVKDASGEYRVAVTPAKEIEAARGKAIKTGSFTAGTKKVIKHLPTSNCEIELSLNSLKSENVFVALSNTKGERVEMCFDVDKSTFSMDRSHSGLTDFSTDFPAVTTAPTTKGKAKSLRLFLDNCSVEAFGSNGEFSMTNLVFPTEPYSMIEVYTDKGKCKVTSLTVYPIRTK